MTITDYFLRKRKGLKKSIEEAVFEAQPYLTVEFCNSFDTEKTKKGTPLRGRWNATIPKYKEDFAESGNYRKLNLSNEKGNKSSFRKKIALVKSTAGIVVTSNASYGGSSYGKDVIENLKRNGVTVFEWENTHDNKIFFSEKLVKNLKKI